MAVSIHGNASAGGAPGAARHGFTLVEMLVVIAIVTLLAAILIPVVSAVRLTAQKTNTAALVQSLSMAIEMYEKNFHAYPGPLDEPQQWGLAPWPAKLRPLPQEIGNSQPTQITMSENLFLGLVGGLTIDLSQQVHFQFSQSNPRIGDLSNSSRSFEPILRDWAADVSSGAFTDSLGNRAFDTTVPEFLDRFSDYRMPILYLRARQGASGVMSDPTTTGPNGLPILYQYDLRQIRPYTMSRIGLLAAPGATHGLMNLGNFGDPLRSPDSAAGSNFSQRYGVNNALPYFRAPTTPSSATNASGSPRMKDKYILISAGADRIYGTADDITNFGSVTY